MYVCSAHSQVLAYSPRSMAPAGGGGGVGTAIYMDYIDMCRYALCAVKGMVFKQFTLG